MTKVQDIFVVAQRRQYEIQRFFDNHSLEHIVVPFPNISDQEFEARREKNQAPFFRPATKDFSYEDFMRAFGQGNDRTVTSEPERARIGWEPAEKGYWFWAEVQARCPRLGTSWNDLTRELNFLCLEEYVIVFHTYKALTNIILDRNTASWLRTRYQFEDSFGAMAVNERDGMVDIDRDWDLAESYDNDGGRLAEVVK